MFKDAIDQMEDDEYIDKLHRQISGLKNDIEMVDQQNLSIMKTAEKHKRKAETLEKQNKRYREALEFYLSKNNWDEGRVYLDGGYRARKALEGEE